MTCSGITRFKTIGVLVGYNEDGKICVMFTVAPEYADWGGYTYGGHMLQDQHGEDERRPESLPECQEGRQEDTPGQSDYNKLCGYRDYICAHVDYNDDAYEDLTDDPYDQRMAADLGLRRGSRHQRRLRGLCQGLPVPVRPVQLQWRYPEHHGRRRCAYDGSGSGRPHVEHRHHGGWQKLPCGHHLCRRWHDRGFPLRGRGDRKTPTNTGSRDEVYYHWIPKPSTHTPRRR